MIKINKGKTEVTKRMGRPTKYPFKELKVGQSYICKANSYSACATARAWAKRVANGWWFESSMSDGKITVWRTK